MKPQKEGEGSSQGTCINDPWTWTAGWRLAVGAGGGRGGGEQLGKNWDNCNGTTTIKKKKNVCALASDNQGVK